MNIEHRQEIVDLAVRYTWALDTKDFDDLRNVFTADATGMLRGVECNGIDNIIERIVGALSGLEVSQHLVGNHQVTIDGSTGTHRCQLHSQHVFRYDDGSEGHLIVGGFYDDRVALTGDGWRISHRTMTQTWIDGDLEGMRKHR